MPAVSVIMPVRDGERWLIEAIESIQEQTLRDFELIIVDDGSVDRSARIISASAQVDKRIRAVRQERSGLVAALNRGLSEAQCDFIARLDADDRAIPERLKRQVQFLDQHPDIGLIGSWAVEIDEDGRVLRRRKPEISPERLPGLLLSTNPFIHSSIMLRREVLNRVGRYRPAFSAAEDYDLWLRVSEITKVANLGEYLVQYRSHPSNLSRQARVRQLFSTRLAQSAALARRKTGRDPTADLHSPPDWHKTGSPILPLNGALVDLFRLLELSDDERAHAADGGRIDLSPLLEREIRMSHAERKVAQLAIVNLLRCAEKSRIARLGFLFFHLIRLHPLRALRLGPALFRKAR